jgi:hypothetical protein
MATAELDRASALPDWLAPINQTSRRTCTPSRLDQIVQVPYNADMYRVTYSKADDKALGKGVRLTQCPRCKRFADKYVEHDFVVLFIDLVLIKPQVCLASLNSHLQSLESKHSSEHTRYRV